MTLELLVTCFCAGVAMGKYDFARRSRNSLLCGSVAAVASAIQSLSSGDYLRAATFAPVIFLVAAGSTYVAYGLKRRYSRQP